MLLIIITLDLPHSILFLPNWFLVKYRFPFVIVLSFFSAKSPTVTQKSVSQKMFLKRANTRQLFFVKVKAKIFLLLKLKNSQVFKIAKSEFEITVQYGL